MQTKNLIGTLLAATAVGFAVGILLAPGSGSETRGKIAKGSKKLTNSLKSTLADSLDSLKKQFNRSLDETAKKGKELFEQTNDYVKT